MATFAENITALREEKGKKRQEVADALGISRASLEYYEKGKRKPDIEVLGKFADYYKVSADYLIGRTEAKTTDKDKRFVCSYTGLSEKAVDVIKNTLNGDLQICRPYFNYFTENLMFTELSLYLERYSFNAIMKDFKALGKEQNRKNYEKSQLILFYAQEYIKDCFKEYIKAGDENAHNPETQ